MKKLSNNFSVFRKLDCNLHNVTMYLYDNDTHSVTNSKLFKILDHGTNSLNEVELARAQIEHKK